MIVLHRGSAREAWWWLRATTAVIVIALAGNLAVDLADRDWLWVAVDALLAAFWVVMAVEAHRHLRRARRRTPIRAVTVERTGISQPFPGRLDEAYLDDASRTAAAWLRDEADDA